MMQFLRQLGIDEATGTLYDVVADRALLGGLTNAQVAALLAAGPGGVAVTGTPTAGQVPTATSSTTAVWATPAGSGTVTATAGALTVNALVLGAGTTDTKVSTGLTSDGASQLNLGVNVTTAGKIKMFGGTSGDATIKTAAAAGTAVQITLPAVDSTLATLGANNYTGNQILGNGLVLGWADAGISRTANATFALGTGADGNTSGSLQATNYYLGNGVTGAWSSAALTLRRASGASFGWAATNATGSQDASLTSPAAATLQLGAADAAAPVAQTAQVQSVVAGTSNINGQPWTFNGSKSTGTGVGGDIVFKASPAGSSGSAQNATTERLRIGAAGAVTVTGDLNVSRLVYFGQFTTGGAPSYIQGTSYYDITMNKLRIGGGAAWETITST